MSYPREIREKSGRILSERRERAVLELNERRILITQKAPHIPQLERELASTAARLSRLLANALGEGESADIEEKMAEIKRFNLAKQRELAKALADAGFEADALEIRHTCPVCKDTGNVDGKLCSCVKNLQKALMYERLGAVSNLADCRFDNFELKYYSDAAAGGPSDHAIMKKAFSQCQKYAESFSLSSPSMLFCGKPGLGKTHLSLAIAFDAIDRGFDVLYVPFHTLLTRLEALRFGGSSDDFQDNLSPVLSCELLILDDLGSEFTTSFTCSVLYDIVNTRQLKALPTIINTNLGSGELSARYGERLCSRLLGCYKILPFVGSDIRLLKKSII